jgi:hypothetical protein
MYLKIGAPSRRDGVNGQYGFVQRTEWKAAFDRLDHTVPHGTGLFLNRSQALNCLATIRLSLRDKVQQTRRDKQLIPVHKIRSTSGAELRLLFEDEDDDEYSLPDVAIALVGCSSIR